MTSYCSLSWRLNVAAGFVSVALALCFRHHRLTLTLTLSNVVSTQNSHHCPILHLLGGNPGRGNLIRMQCGTYLTTGLTTDTHWQVRRIILLQLIPAGEIGQHQHQQWADANKQTEIFYLFFYFSGFGRSSILFKHQVLYFSANLFLLKSGSYGESENLLPRAWLALVRSSNKVDNYFAP